MAAALRAGIPQVPCPVMLDQTHNAKDLIRLRVAPGMIPYKKLSYRNLSKMIDKVLSNKKSIRNSASTLGKEIAHECETSLDKCCDIIESSTVPRF